MQIEFLIEDKSGGKLISEVMEHYKKEEGRGEVDYHILSYKGIGGLPRGKNAKIVKSEQLLSELPKRLRAIQYQYMGVSDIAIFVVVDNDERDTDSFYEELNKIAERNMISMDHVFCIAVEEMEAWLLGDYEAMQKAYPKVKDRIISKYSGYEQDRICGTWEYLADMLTPKGIKAFHAKYHSVYEIGKKKIEWAERIGSEMSIRKNRSPSFLRFLDELDKRVAREI